MSFVKTEMSVSKKVQGSSGANEYQEIGKVPYWVPTLDEFGINAAVKKDEQGNPEVDDDGLPLYADDKHDMLFSALVQYVKMNVRNKLVSGTVDLKLGAVIPSNWEQFLAESTGRGEALKIISEAKKAFAQYVNGLDKKPEIKAAIISLFGNKAGLTLQSQAIKSRFLEYVTDFASGLSEDDLERYKGYLGKLEEAANTEAVTLD